MLALVKNPRGLRGPAARTVLAVTAAVVALVLLARQAHGVDFTQLLSDAHPASLGVAAGLSLIPLLGAAGALLALSPVRLPLGSTIVAQIATSFTNIITPASLGGSALLARFVYRRGVPAPAAAASVALVYATSTAGSCALILAATMATGRQVGIAGRLPGLATVALIVAGVAAVAGLVSCTLMTGLRHGNPLADRILASLGSTLRQGRWALRHPGRLAGGVGAGLVVLVGSAATLDACLRVYGLAVPLTSVVLVLTIGTAIGTAAPVPGGIGPVEASLATGLTVAGADASGALLAVLLYRLLTFWIRVPLGWCCLLWLRHTEQL